MIIDLGFVTSFEFNFNDYQVSTYGTPLIIYLQFTTTFNSNMAGYMATPIACRWAGAVVEVT